jgi:hypothetical protein
MLSVMRRSNATTPGSLARSMAPLIRRTLPAMVVTVGGFLIARLGVQALRGHLLTPLRSVHSLVSPTGDVSLGTAVVAPQNWVLQTHIIDHSGHAVADQAVLQICRAVDPAAVARCVTSHGFHQIDICQPLSRYWALQGIEFAIFTTLTIVLLATAAYTVTQQKRRRTHRAGSVFAHRRGGLRAAAPDSHSQPDQTLHDVTDTSIRCLRATVRSLRDCRVGAN